jgi:hypothetical protein
MLHTLEHTIFLAESYFKSTEWQEMVNGSIPHKLALKIFEMYSLIFRLNVQKCCNCLDFGKRRVKTVVSKPGKNTLNICYNC